MSQHEELPTTTTTTTTTTILPTIIIRLISSLSLPSSEVTRAEYYSDGHDYDGCSIDPSTSIATPTTRSSGLLHSPIKSDSGFATSETNKQTEQITDGPKPVHVTPLSEIHLRQLLQADITRRPRHSRPELQPRLLPTRHPRHEDENSGDSDTTIRPEMISRRHTETFPCPRSDFSRRHIQAMNREESEIQNASRVPKRRKNRRLPVVAPLYHDSRTNLNLFQETNVPILQIKSEDELQESESQESACCNSQQTFSQTHTPTTSPDQSSVPRRSFSSGHKFKPTFGLNQKTYNTITPYQAQDPEPFGPKLDHLNPFESEFRNNLTSTGIDHRPDMRRIHRAASASPGRVEFEVYLGGHVNSRLRSQTEGLCDTIDT